VWVVLRDCRGFCISSHHCPGMSGTKKSLDSLTNFARVKIFLSSFASCGLCPIQTPKYLKQECFQFPLLHTSRHLQDILLGFIETDFRGNCQSIASDDHGFGYSLYDLSRAALHYSKLASSKHCRSNYSTMARAVRRYTSSYFITHSCIAVMVAVQQATWWAWSR
jgi:hypothetical protein